MPFTLAVDTCGVGGKAQWRRSRLVRRQKAEPHPALPGVVHKDRSTPARHSAYAQIAGQSVHPIDQRQQRSNRVEGSVSPADFGL
jgi:hypothetical protein